VCYKVNFTSYGVAVYLHIVTVGGGSGKTCVPERVEGISVNVLFVCFQLVALTLEPCHSVNLFLLESEYLRSRENLCIYIYIIFLWGSIVSLLALSGPITVRLNF
jgi:hypothetical protein